MGFAVKKGSEKGSRRGSEKEVSRRCLERPLGEYDPLGVHPNGVKAGLLPEAVILGCCINALQPVCKASI